MKKIEDLQAVNDLIAACLKLPEGTVKSQLSRGRALLREALKEEIEL